MDLLNLLISQGFKTDFFLTYSPISLLLSATDHDRQRCHEFVEAQLTVARGVEPSRLGKSSNFMEFDRISWENMGKSLKNWNLYELFCYFLLP